jgi:predicted nucleotidyltransferase component of viral defense system
LIDLAGWVAEEIDPERRAFRQAVQLVLRGIAQSPALSPIMIMKGGVLLAIRYRSTRFTRDIDFSTPRHINEVDVPQFLAAVEEALATVSADNEYGLALRLQRKEVRPPPGEGVNFPTLKLGIGYARRLQPSAMRRLAANGAQVVELDYSFNEWVSDIERQALDGGALCVYPFHGLVAEKLRAVLQQPIRGRYRHQDIYDLYLLLSGSMSLDAADRARVWEKLVEAARVRQVPLHIAAMRDPDVVERSRRHYYENLNGLISGPLPDFAIAYALVQLFYESLPWPETAATPSS